MTGASGFTVRSLDDIFERMPGREDDDEADIESLDAAEGRLWICGSHCVVRRQVSKTASDRVDPRFRIRKSRRLLGSAAFDAILDGNAAGSEALPFSGKNSLRRLLADDPYLRPFIDLPSKENGLDIEGLAVTGEGILLGLRGPLVDSVAVVVELRLAVDTAIAEGISANHFLNLDGLGVRDLAKADGRIIILAGPASSAPGPFRLYAWKPRRTAKIQKPDRLYEWPGSSEAPEGICCHEDGILVVYDVGNNPGRIDDGRVRIDRLAGL